MTIKAAYIVTDMDMVHSSDFNCDPIEFKTERAALKDATKRLADSEGPMPRSGFGGCLTFSASRRPIPSSRPSGRRDSMTTKLKWIWDWHVEITIGLYDGIPVLWFKWTQRTPPPWR